jgi:hypothetical protein
MKTLVTTLSTLILMSVGCKSVEKMIDMGDFDTALIRSTKKIAGKENLNKKYVLAIEEAFRKATSRDMNLVEQTYHSDKAIDWSRVIGSLEKIEKRQRAVQPFLPLVAKDGYQANFAFVKTAEIKKNAIDHFLEYTYRDGLSCLDRGREANKAAARKAYDLFSQLWQYDNEYLDARALQDEAKNLGISHVLIKVVNATHQHIDQSLLDQMAQQNFRSEKWITYHFDDQTTHLDRELNILLDDIKIGPERIYEVRYSDTRKVEDGFEYVLDQNGNVTKDTLGNDIKIAVFKTSRANVVRVHQEKTGMVLGRIINTNLLSGEIDYIPFDAQLVFEHFAGNFRGDRRALSAESKELVGISPLPFPDDRQMVYDLMQTLHPLIGDKIRRSHLLV